jgi:uncharacterized membrane protein YdbT with pleckstrin-like domain
MKLDSDEKIILEVRRHWFIFLVKGLMMLFLALVPLIGIIIFFIYAPTELAAGQASLIFFFYFSWLIFVWLATFTTWTNYYLDVWFLTNKRLIDVNQINIFHREIASLHLERIQDVSVEIAGIIPTLLKFGEINVQTAGAVGKFVIHDAGTPERVKKIILDEYHRKVKGSGETSPRV